MKCLIKVIIPMLILRDAKAYELSLVQRNRVYKKTQMDS